THQIVGMGAAFFLLQEEREAEQKRIAGLRDRLWDDIKTLGGLILNGDETLRIAAVLNVSVEGVEGDSLLLALRELALSSSSACTSASREPSHVLRAIGV